MKASKSTFQSNIIDKILCFTGGALLCLGSLSEGFSQILQVDFGNNASSTYVQTGWTYWGLETTGSTLFPSKSFTTSAGSIAATISSNFTLDVNGDLQASAVAPSIRDRSTLVPPNAGAFTESSLYRDMVINVGSGSGLALELSGLTANTQYSITLYSYDSGTGSTVTRTNTFTNITGGASTTLGSVTYTTGSGSYPTLNEQFSVTAVLTSDSLGRLIVTESKNSSDSFAGLNGFSLASVPEPGFYGVILIGLFGFVCSRKFRKDSRQTVN